MTNTPGSTSSSAEPSPPAPKKSSKRKQTAPRIDDVGPVPTEQSAPAPEKSSKRKQTAPRTDDVGPVATEQSAPAPEKSSKRKQTAPRTDDEGPVAAEQSAPAPEKSSKPEQDAPRTDDVGPVAAEQSAAAPKKPSNRKQAAPGTDSTGPPPAEGAKKQRPPIKIDVADLWQKVRQIKIPRPPSRLKGLLRHRPSGLEIMVGLLIIVAGIMVAVELFGSQPRLHPTPAVLSRSDIHKVPPGVVRVLNTLERNAQVDRRTISRLEAQLNGLRLQFDGLRDLIKSRLSTPPPAAGSPGTTAPSVAPAPPEPPPAVPPAASRPAARPDRRLTDLEIRMDELTRQVEALKKRLGRTRRPR